MASTGDYLLGMVALAAIALAMAVAGRALRRALLPGWCGAPALLASGLLGLAMLVVISELLGIFGLLDGVLLTAACLIVGGGALRIEPMLMPPDAEPKAGLGTPEADAGAGSRDARQRPTWELWAAVGIAFVVAVQWAGPTLLALDRGIFGGDSLWYHMPFAAHIAQTGSVTELLFTDPLYLNWFYPQNSELLHADGLLLFGDDFLSPLLNLAWLGAALFAAWCIGRPYGAGTPAVAAVAALMSADLLSSRQPGNANNDVAAIALLLASVAILVNARSATARGPLIVAGLAAGLALGTKLTVVPPVGALTIGVIVIAASGERLRSAGAWLAGLFAGGGFWYARDLIASGTPFPFVDLGPLTKPEELQGREPFSIAHYLTDTDVWGRFFTPALHERLGDLWPLYLAAAVAGAVLWLWRAERLERMLAGVVAVSALAYLLTPLGASGPEGSPVGFRLNIRYLAPALALGLVLAAIPPPLLRDGLRRWWRLGAMGLFGLLIAVAAGAAEGGQVLLDTDRVPGSLLLALALVGLPAGLVLLRRRGIPRAALAAAALVPLLALVALGVGAREDYLELRYSADAPDYPSAEQPALELAQGLGQAYEWAREVEDSKIALSGTTGALFQYGLWGRESSNEVVFVGRREDRGAFSEFAECPEWIAALNAGDYDYLVTTPAYDQDNPASATQPLELLWISGAPNAIRITPPPTELPLEAPDPGYSGPPLVDVWELNGPLDPAACAQAPPRGRPTPGAPAD
ncbi:MAG: glycosyltransferase family 39 protein [Actinomycetota bacterium]|nr:glycosyltransferase family 39 protein [Actinomycetota bacterium]